MDELENMLPVSQLVSVTSGITEESLKNLS